MKTKHTPAPWKYEPSTKTIRSVPANYWLATMDSWDGAVAHEANARLMAAAPELLALVKRLTDSAECCVSLVPAWGDGKAPDRLELLCKEARAAIATAEGSSATPESEVPEHLQSSFNLIAETEGPEAAVEWLDRQNY